MVKFEELENQIRQSKGNYSLTDDGQGKKTYTVFSRELRNSLRNVINPTLWEEWQIRFPTQGENFYEYRKEQDGIFGCYKKSEAENSPDEFVIVAENKTSIEKENFEKTTQSMEEARASIKETRKRIRGREEIKQNENSENNKKDDYISFSTTWNEEGEIIEKKIEQPVDLAKRKEIEDSWGFKAIGEAFSMLNRKNGKGTSTQNNQNQQQAQIRQESDPKFLFWKEGKKS